MAMIDIDTVPPAHSRSASGHVYVRSPEPIEFRAFESLDEEVPETKHHLENRTALYLVLKELYATTSSIGSQQFVYYNPTDAQQCLSPDSFVKRDVPDRPFPVWKTWEHGAPDVAVEIISELDHRDAHWDEKLARYRVAGIGEIVRFDAEDRERPIRVWDHVSGDVVERAASDPDLRFCHALGLWWVVQEDANYGPMLRLARDREGRDRLPTPTEGRVLAEMAQREAQQALVVAEHEKLLAEQAKRDAQQEKLVAQQEKLLAEQKLRNETEARRAAESEIERLREALAQARRGG